MPPADDTPDVPDDGPGHPDPDDGLFIGADLDGSIRAPDEPDPP